MTLACPDTRRWWVRYSGSRSSERSTMTRTSRGSREVLLSAATFDGLGADDGIRVSNDGVTWSPWMDPALLDPARDGPLDWTLGVGPDGPRTVARPVPGCRRAPVHPGHRNVRDRPGATGHRGLLAAAGAAARAGSPCSWPPTRVASRPSRSAGVSAMAAGPTWRRSIPSRPARSRHRADALVRAELRVTDRAGHTTTAATEAAGWTRP